MRRLNRRLARWQRYARRYRPGPWPRNHNVARCDIRDPAGFVRAYSAVWAELERRQLCELYDPMYDDGRPCDCIDCRDAYTDDYGDDEFDPDDDAGHGDSWRPVETVDTGGLL